MLASPKLVQSLIAIVGDLSLLGLSGEWSVVLHLATWSVYYMQARTLSNSLESTLVLCVLYLLSRAKNDWAAAFLMCVCVFVRPSSAVCWVVWAAFQPAQRLLCMAPAGALACVSLVFADSLYYGRFVLTPLNLVAFNVASSSFYGTHPWYWYFTSGIPTLLMFWTPLHLYSIWSSTKQFNLVIPFVFAPLFALSFLPHKEFRFLLPSVSVLCAVSGQFLRRLFFWSKPLVIVLILLNAALAGYFSLSHQAGPLAATQFLRNRARPGDSICYLTPCHSLPEYSAFHIPGIQIHALQCNPHSFDESDSFFDNPNPDKFMEKWSCHWIVAFEPLVVNAPIVFEAEHADFPSDSRHGTMIRVYKRGTISTV